jgi:hypothetical protein
MTVTTKVRRIATFWVSVCHSSHSRLPSSSCNLACLVPEVSIIGGESRHMSYNNNLVLRRLVDRYALL